MNAFVLHATLVCLAIAGGVKCKIGGSGTDINQLQQGSENFVTVNTAQHHSFKDENPSYESLRDRCLKNSPKEDAYEKFKEDMRNFYICLKTNNITEMIKNLQAMHLNENYNSLLKGICTKLPDWHSCRRNYTTSLMECYTENEKSFITNLQNMSSVIESFTCQNDGERITAFFSDGGLNCIMNRSTTLGQCVKTLENKSYFPKNSNRHKTFSMEYLMTYFKFNREQCNDLRELQSCLVEDLRHCDRPTVANMVNTGIELALRQSPCSEFMTTMA